MLFERALFTVVLDGIDRATKDPESLVRFLRAQQIPEAEAREVQKYFLASPPKVRHGYAREDMDFPAIQVILSNEAQTVKFIGDDGGVEGLLDPEEPADEIHVGMGLMYDPDNPDSKKDQASAIESPTFQLIVYAAHPGVTLYYYALLKWWLYESLDLLKMVGALEVNISGSDLLPDPRYVPPGLFARSLTVSIDQEFAVPKLRELKAFQIRGLFVTDRTTADGDGIVPYQGPA